MTRGNDEERVCQNCFALRDLGEPRHHCCGIVLRQFASQVGTARRGYQRFLEEGMKQRHDEKYYQSLDQRFLGKDSFVQETVQRTAMKEIEIKARRVGFARLLEASCALHKINRKALLQAGRRRQWVAARAQLIYLARERSGMTTKELGRRLHRDPSMISRL